jgi:Zn-finger in Ran binding protein and others/Double zinc ribbon
MAKKTLGYVELEWECPSCHTRNAGATKACVQCGAPRPEETGYQQAAEEKLITDEAKIAAAKAGADIFCAYCGAPNLATAKVCKQCGADLGEGTAAVSGQVLGGWRQGAAAPVSCPSCGASNPATAFKCSQCGAPLRQEAVKPQPASVPAGKSRMLPFIIAGIVAIVILVVGLIAAASRRTAVIGEVSGVNWRRSIAVEALVPVELEAWANEIPSGVQVGRCTQQLYKVQDEPAPDAREVCGTAYVVDTGSGYGEVQQDCRYEIYADRCQYESTAWRPIAPIVLQGSDLSPAWPSQELGQNQRSAGSSENYAITFDVDGKSYVYHPANESDFTQFSPGSQWRLQVNSLGTVRVEGPR